MFTNLHERPLVMISETKGLPPIWYSNVGLGQGVGGVPITINEELAKYTTETEDIEDTKQEILLIELQIIKMMQCILRRT